MCFVESGTRLAPWRWKREAPIRLLLVEDDPDLTRRLIDALAGSEFVVDHAADGETAAAMGMAVDYDAVVLDIGLPRLSGLQVLAGWRRAERGFPVLILTAQNSWSQRVEGLNAGADDYLGKPFQTEELIARLRALVRRSHGRASGVLRHGPIAIDTVGNAVTVDEAPVDLTASELRLLMLLVLRRGRLVSQAELVESLYPGAETVESNTIEVYVARLRKKLGRDLIKTVRGLGYRLA